MGQQDNLDLIAEDSGKQNLVMVVDLSCMH
jgi:hypothetical protein